MVSTQRLIFVNLLQRLGKRSCIALTTYVLVSLSALIALPAYGALNVTVNRNPINLEDTVQITIEATENVSGKPDLTPLKESFDLLGVSQSSSFSFGTGQGSQRSIKRIITAQAKQAGVITIPAIQWGNLSSAPLTLKVLDAQSQAQSNGDPRDFYTELSISNTEPYVQEQTVLTVKSYSNKSYTGSLFSDIESPAGLLLKRIGSQDDSYQTTVNGVAYIVRERKFLLSAESSGTFNIDPVIFKAQFGEDDIWGRYKAPVKTVRSNSLNIAFKAIPDKAKQPWLPAKQITLSHFISEGEYSVGEPITLTLSTIADGLVGEQIPDISLSLPDGLKSYPDQPKLETNWSNGSVIAKRIDKLAIIPVKPGDFELPPIQLHWWNTQTDQAETATIEGIHFSVTGEAPAVTPSADTTSSVNTSDVEMDDSASPAPPTPILNTESSPLWKITTAIFAGLWLLTLLALLWVLRSRKMAAASLTNKPAPQLSKAALLRQLKTASAEEAAQAILQWAQAEIAPNICSIGQIQGYADKPLREALTSLNQYLYSKETSQWQAEPLITALQQFKGPPTTAEQPHHQGLYPE